MAEEIVFTEEEQKKLNKMFEGWMRADHVRKLGDFLKLNESVKEGNIVFAGDSITEGYPISEMFSNEHIIYNRGIGGITSSQLLEHLDTHVLALNPSKVFVLIGTNDIHWNRNDEQTFNNIRNIIKTINEHNSNTKIHVISIYPVNEDPKFAGRETRENKDIILINKEIKKIVSEFDEVTYIDLYDNLLKDNNLNEDYTFDGLHLNIDGYRVVSKELVKYINE